MKPGWKTSEFWLALAALLISEATATGLIPSEGTWQRVAATLAGVLAALGYGAQRARVKGTK